MQNPVDRAVLRGVLCNRPPLFSREDYLKLQNALKVSAERRMGVGVEREDGDSAERQVGVMGEGPAERQVGVGVTGEGPAERQVGVGVGVGLKVGDWTASDYIKNYARKTG